MNNKNKSFIDIRLPEEISLMAIGGPVFDTSVISGALGVENRNIKNINPIMQYKINYSKMSPSMMQNLLSFFYIVKGRAYSFRFKDFIDCQSNSQEQNFIILENNINQAQDKFSIKLQLCKKYCFKAVDNEYFYIRKITKPNLKNFKMIYDEKDLVLNVDFKMDFNSGIIHCNSVKQIDKLRAEFEFDVCVRFASDYLKFNNVSHYLFDVSEIELIEVLE